MVGGQEVKDYIDNGFITNYCILDDNIDDFVGYVENVIKVEKSYIGITEENIKDIDKCFS